MTPALSAVFPWLRPVFADLSLTELAGVLTAAGAALGGAAAFVTKLLDGRTARKLNEQKTVIDHWITVCDRLEETVRLYQRADVAKQEAIDKLAGLYSEARVRRQEVYGELRLMHAIARQAVAELRETGRHVEEPPDVPPLRAIHASDEVEFIQRQTAENTEMLRQATDSVRQLKKGGATENDGADTANRG